MDKQSDKQPAAGPKIKSAKKSKSAKGKRRPQGKAEQSGKSSKTAKSTQPVESSSQTTGNALPLSGPYPTNEDIVRNKLMDAGIICLEQYGINKTTMRHIALQSGISRQTVYNYYRSKHDLLAEAFLREGIKLANTVNELSRQYPSLADKFVHGFLFIYHELPKNPILAQILEPGNTFYGEVGMGYPFGEFGKMAFADVFVQYPELQPYAEDMSELWIRNVMSLLTMPGPSDKSPEQLEQYIRRCLVPGLHLP